MQSCDGGVPVSVVVVLGNGTVSEEVVLEGERAVLRKGKFVYLARLAKAVNVYKSLTRCEIATRPLVLLRLRQPFFSQRRTFRTKVNWGLTRLTSPKCCVVTPGFSNKKKHRPNFAPWLNYSRSGTDCGPVALTASSRRGGTATTRTIQ